MLTYFFPVEVRMRDFAVAVLGGQSLATPLSGPAAWLKLALGDSKVAQALRLWGAGPPSWVNLYRVLEVIESDVGGKIYEAGWAPKKEVTRFTHTPNRAETLGDQARHGKERTSPPRNPMSLADARSLLTRLLDRWLCEKGARGSVLPVQTAWGVKDTDLLSLDCAEQIK